MQHPHHIDSALEALDRPEVLAERHPELKADAYAGTGVVNSILFELTDSEAALQQSVDAQRKAVESSAEGKPNPNLLINLGVALYHSALRTGELEHYRDAIATIRLAVEGLPDGSPLQSLHYQICAKHCAAYMNELMISRKYSVIP